MSRSRANELYRYACDLNGKHGCNLLGFAYLLGKSVPRSKSTARIYFKKACRLGITKACSMGL